MINSIKHIALKVQRQSLMMALVLMVCATGCMLLASCARMGQPDGGWYDETPPRVIGAAPAQGAVHSSQKKVSIFFDEYIKLENATEKVVVSPPQLEQPEIKAAGKRIEVKLLDSLRANTTYTIDFSDAIVDNNENNPLGNFTYSFSTGNNIDTLQVEGNVVLAENLEPVKGILVGLYSAPQFNDSTFLTTPLLRVARADSRGHFIIRGVAPGTYHVMALADADGNYCFSQKSEQIAFSTDTISPYVTSATRQDTLWTDSLHIKNIEQVKYQRFMPDELVLRAFTEKLTDRFFIKSERKEPNCISLYFSYGDGTLPDIKGLDFDSDNAFLIEPSLRADTIHYWLRDTALVQRDTLTLEARYLQTDSLGQLQPQTDTLTLVNKINRERRAKLEKKAYDDWFKQQEKKRKRGEAYDSIMPPKPLDMNLVVPSDFSPQQNISLAFNTPIERIDTAAIHLYAKHDTLWYRAKCQLVVAEADSLPLQHHREYRLRADWQPDIEYSLEIDSMAFTDLYGLVTSPVKRGFKVQGPDQYGTLDINISGFDGKPVVVQLLDSNDKVVKQLATRNGNVLFEYVPENTYYLRMIDDENDNGRWDTGCYTDNRQPERVFYFPESIDCKRKWDVSRQWNPLDRPFDRQKPSAITKQKGETQKTVRKRNLQRAQKLGIELPERLK